jgi:replication factor C subunit 3/5
MSNFEYQSSQVSESKPWVEKYRPTDFENIVLDPYNRRIFRKIIDNAYFPNLLFYGPPGTGKTTTIMNLIDEYQTRYFGKSKGTVIHLNASDERGIDIIRNQIYQFVRSKNLFEIGFKFVILDEVDYMTKSAQQALKTLLQTCNNNVRFCLICNYISKIDESLQQEFISIRFNQLPKSEIDNFIQKIANAEKIPITASEIDAIQTMYQSDIRSMINFIQLNQNLQQWSGHIIHSGVWETIKKMIHDRNISFDEFAKAVHNASMQYNMDKKILLRCYFNYLLRNYPEIITPEYLHIIEECIHNDANIQNILQYYFMYCRK